MTKHSSLKRLLTHINSRLEDLLTKTRRDHAQTREIISLVDDVRDKHFPELEESDEQ